MRVIAQEMLGQSRQAEGQPIVKASLISRGQDDRQHFETIKGRLDISLPDFLRLKTPSFMRFDVSKKLQAFLEATNKICTV